ncbi:probable metabolite transport protein CsbC [Diabrotica virgifera virgifera]|uniref:Major facilitator superfamily (MFS) profile domain-containing protein n=1 Tax=Diabrotica virgifera virgifera TaxID=50390 RepID=A0ABM5K452_DIAVI|nr:probable metabolite transport protein CsbC [Diabrotica virgifera virgifera]
MADASEKLSTNQLLNTQKCSENLREILSTNQLLDTQKCSENLKKVTPWLMYFCAFSADLPLITLGSCFVWGSPAIPKLRSNDTKINPLGEAITPFQTSVVVSASEFTMIFLLSVMAKVSNLLGRRKCLIIHSILFVIFLSAVAMARSIYVYYIFFLLNGMNLAGVIVNSTIYNSEVADDKSRAWMGVIDGLCLPLGTLLGFIFGSFTSIRVYSFLCATPALFYLLLSFYTVESPMYLLYKNKDDEALKVLKDLRKHKTMDEIQSEFKRMKDLSIEANHQRKNCDIFSTSSSRKALFIALSLCFFQQVTGVSNILAYAGTIFTEAGASVSGNTVSILMGTMQVVVNIMVVSSVNKIGRRRLVLASALGCSLSTFTLGIYFYLKSYCSVDNFNWLPVVCALTFIGSYALGLGPIVPSYMSELFPSEVRAMGVAIATTLEAIIACSVNFGFPLLMGQLGIYGCMFIYSGFTLTGFLILFLIVPETTGKGFNEIQLLLKKKLIQNIIKL